MANEQLKNNYKNIANAIRSKTGEDGLMTAEEMPAKIEAIETGITPEGKKTITSNGDNIDVYNYATVQVNVPSVQPSGTLYISVYQNQSITENVTQYASIHVENLASQEIEADNQPTSDVYAMYNNVKYFSDNLSKVISIDRQPDDNDILHSTYGFTAMEDESIGWNRYIDILGANEYDIYTSAYDEPEESDFAVQYNMGYYFLNGIIFFIFKDSGGTITVYVNDKGSHNIITRGTDNNHETITVTALLSEFPIGKNYEIDYYNHDNPPYRVAFGTDYDADYWTEEEVTEWIENNKQYYNIKVLCLNPKVSVNGLDTIWDNPYIFETPAS